MSEPKRAPAPLIRGDLRRRKTAELADRILVHGQRPLQAGAELGLTRRQTYAMMESDAYERERTTIQARFEASRERVMDEVVRGLYAMAPKAVARTEDLMLRTRDDAVALRACNSVLDRIGARAPAKTHNTHRIELGEASIERIRKALEDIKMIQALEGTWKPVFHNPTGPTDPYVNPSDQVTRADENNGGQSRTRGAI